MDYILGAKIDQLVEKIDTIIQMQQYDLERKYPELTKGKK
jgi:hypothetical protein